MNRPIPQFHSIHCIIHTLAPFSLWFSFINRPFCADIETDARCSLSRSFVVTLVTLFQVAYTTLLCVDWTRRFPRRSLSSSTKLERRARYSVYARPGLTHETLFLLYYKLSCVFEIQNKPLTPTVTLRITYVMPFFASRASFECTYIEVHHIHHPPNHHRSIPDILIIWIVSSIISGIYFISILSCLSRRK